MSNQDSHDDSVGKSACHTSLPTKVQVLGSTVKEENIEKSCPLTSTDKKGRLTRTELHKILKALTK